MMESHEFPLFIIFEQATTTVLGEKGHGAQAMRSSRRALVMFIWASAL